MLASTTPFKIVNDENQSSVFKATKGGRGGLQQATAGKAGGLSVFTESTNKIPIGSAMKSTRKALVDVTNSIVHASNQTALRGGKTQSTENSTILGVNKPIMVQFKVSENPKSSDVKQAAISSAVSSGTDRKDTDDMICSGMAEELGDEDPYDYVMRRSSQIEVTINPCCGTGVDHDTLDDIFIADLNAYANTLTFGDVSINDDISAESTIEVDAPDVDF